MAKHKLDKFTKHELVDRTSLAASFFEDNIVNHPAAIQDFRAEVEVISDALFDLYQKVGQKYS